MKKYALRERKGNVKIVKYYVVTHTNVIVSSFLQPGSIPNQVTQEALYEMLLPLISDKILNEYKDVLTRNKFKIEKKRIDNFFVLNIL